MTWYSNPVEQVPPSDYRIGLPHRITASDYASDYRIGLPHRITASDYASDYRIGLPHRITALDYRWFASFEMATKQVHPMDFTGNISENWARWKELMELVLAGPSANKWTETQKAAQFLICIGQQGRDMARAWVSSGELSEDDKKVLQSCLPSSKHTARQERM